ncbi:shikimate kinase [bacterium]|nr:shikimate kinase [bacterium]
MNIVLIGYRGTGKSSVARILSKEFGFSVFDMDEEIVKRASIPISEIVEKFGWDKFRNLESAIAEQVSNLDNYIIDTGGGVILRDKNVANLRKNSKVFWLKAGVATIAERIKHGTHRPSLTDEKTFIDEVEEVLMQRKEKYEKAADYTIDTSKLSTVDVAKKIVSLMKQEEKHG